MTEENTPCYDEGDERDAEDDKTIAESPHLCAFLTGLPSFKPENFTRHSPDGVTCPAAANAPAPRRPSLYICIKDYPEEQVITTEKSNILLRSLHTQWNQKTRLKNGRAVTIAGKAMSSHLHETSRKLHFTG